MQPTHQYADESQDRETLKSLYSLSQNYHEVSRDFEQIRGVQLFPNMVRWLLNGYNPGRNMRRKLNWLPLIPTPPCHRCGEVHTLGDICPHETPVRVIVQRNGHRKPAPPRVAIRKDDPVSAARTIKNNLPPDMVAEIVRRLNESHDH